MTIGPANPLLDGNADATAVYALLTVDNRKLVLTQRDVRSLEPVADVVPTTADPEGASGRIRFEDQLWPVYVLAEDLSVMANIPSSRRLCALINGPDLHFALACDQFDLVAERDLKLHPVPACMTTPRSAMDALAVYGDEIALLCSVTGLAGLLGLAENGNS